MGLLDTRNDSAKVRILLPEIEAELEAGAKRPEIYAALKSKHGLTLTYDGFLSALKRARKKQQLAKRSVAKADKSDGEVAPINEPSEAPVKKEAKQEKAKRGIISKKDFKPSDDIDDKLSELTGKNRKY
ncbi:hypothetical protein [Halomonas sp. 3A7M]|uniref:hypothetical protein n=1 Tax=Halomonas sp. 3A7M TaxID=2742616 RepID=UPI001868137A|nr:hypothetical protein [Halomonas sp. 3A7M]